MGNSLSSDCDLGILHNLYHTTSNVETNSERQMDNDYPVDVQHNQPSVSPDNSYRIRHNWAQTRIMGSAANGNIHYSSTSFRPSVIYTLMLEYLSRISP